MKTYRVISFSVPSETGEAVSEALWECGTLGVETVSETPERISLRAFFPPDADPDVVRPAVEAAIWVFGHLPEKLEDFESVEKPNEDWLKNWKDGWTCQAIGDRWLIVPSWRRDEALANPDWNGRLWIEIDPGMAFGTGTHETTRLCLSLFDTAATSVASVLDVGTGTGILAIAAAKAFPDASVLACDNDPEAVTVARENVAINGLADRLELRVASAEDYPADGFDIVFANLTADVIIPMANDLLRVTKAGGFLILSGILDVQIDSVTGTMIAAGGQVAEVRADGEWRGALVYRLPQPEHRDEA